MTPRAAEGGFTLIEILVALTIAMIGLAGVLGLEHAGFRATGYSRHATEAAVLAEDKLERLRTMRIDDLVDDEEQVAPDGSVGNGAYTRRWTVAWTGDVATLAVTVAWLEEGSEPHAITYRTKRQR